MTSFARVIRFCTARLNRVKFQMVFASLSIASWFGRIIAVNMAGLTADGEIKMIDFILAGITYVCLMFVVLFCISYATIGICYGAAQIYRRCVRRLSQPHLVMK
jgi:hypothetical protein